MNGTLLHVKDIGFKLKKPCGQCPWRKNAPYHEGIMANLRKYDEAIEEGRFLFSCHATDPRSDYGGKEVDGKIQHCAGALIYQKNTGRLKKNPHLLKAWVLGLFDPKAVRRSKAVFGSFIEMVQHYYAGYEEERSKQ